jgi:hypothetical protein
LAHILFTRRVLFFDVLAKVPPVGIGDDRIKIRIVGDQTPVLLALIAVRVKRHWLSDWALEQRLD